VPTAAAAVPKHVSAEQAILDRVRSNRYSPGTKLPSNRDLARELGIAPMTLRHAIDRLVEQGLLERRHRVGTFVRRSPVYPNIAMLFFHVNRLGGNTLPGISLNILGEAAEKKQRRVRAMLMTSPLQSPTQVYKELRAMEVGAVGLQGFLDEDADFIRGLSGHIPCVLFNKRLNGLSLPSAMPDAFAMGRLMCDYFAQRGRRRVAMGRFLTSHQIHQELTYTVQSECARRGLHCDRRHWLEATKYDGAEDEQIKNWIDQILSAPQHVDALILSTTTAADYATERMAERGEQVGRERDVIPLHTLLHGQNASTLRAPYPIMASSNIAAAEAATQMLMDIVEGKSKSDQVPEVRVPPELVMPDGE